MPVPPSSELPGCDSALPWKQSCGIVPSNKNLDGLIQEHNQKYSLYSSSMQCLGPDLEVLCCHPDVALFLFCTGKSVSSVGKLLIPCLDL